MSVFDTSKVVGSTGSNLVLQTAGKIYVQVGGRFYELNYRDQGPRQTIVKQTVEQKQEAPQIDTSNFVDKDYLRATLYDYLSKRDWESIKETQTALENSLLEGFTESISPITINTMQAIVGSEQLQFDFIQSLENDTVVSHGLYIIGKNELHCTRGVIKHYTVDGPDSVQPNDDNKALKQYCRWEIENDAEFTLYDEDKSYYLYIVAEKITGWESRIDGDSVNPANKEGIYAKTGEAHFMTSQVAISMENYEDPTNYYFLYAVINSVSGNSRSIATMNGFTEILPGQITAYKYQSPDGQQYLDFKQKEYVIGDPSSYMRWNQDEGLVVKGKVSIIGGDTSVLLDKIRDSLATSFANRPCLWDGDTQDQKTPYPLYGDSEQHLENWPKNDSSIILIPNVDCYVYTENGTTTQHWYIWKNVTVTNSSDNTETIEQKWVSSTSSDEDLKIIAYAKEAETAVDIPEYSYLQQAIKGRTDIEGGLILSNMIKLGYSTGNAGDVKDYYDKFQVMSGISGIAVDSQNNINPKAIAAWYGGNMVDKDDFEIDYQYSESDFKSGYDYFIDGEWLEYNDKKYKYYSGEDALSKFSQNSTQSDWINIDQHIYSLLENLKFWKYVDDTNWGDVVFTDYDTLNDGTIYYPNYNAEDASDAFYEEDDITSYHFYRGVPNNIAKTLFRMDGSGYLADGLISWNNSGDFKIGNILNISDGILTVGNFSNNKETLKITENDCKIINTIPNNSNDSFLNVIQNDSSIISINYSNMPESAGTESFIYTPREALHREGGWGGGVTIQDDPLFVPISDAFSIKSGDYITSIDLDIEVWFNRPYHPHWQDPDNIVRSNGDGEIWYQYNKVEPVVGGDNINNVVVFKSLFDWNSSRTTLIWHRSEFPNDQFYDRWTFSKNDFQPSNWNIFAPNNILQLGVKIPKNTMVKSSSINDSLMQIRINKSEVIVHRNGVNYVDGAHFYKNGVYFKNGNVGIRIINSQIDKWDGDDWIQY